jgi:hypothetical protein
VVKVPFLTLIAALSILWTVIPAQASKPPRSRTWGTYRLEMFPRYDNAFLRELEKQGYILPGEIPRYDDAFWHGLVKRRLFP